MCVGVVVVVFFFGGGFFQNGYPYLTVHAEFKDMYYLLHPSVFPGFVSRKLSSALAFVGLSYLMTMPAPPLVPQPTSDLPTSPVDAVLLQEKHYCQEIVDFVCGLFPVASNGGIVVGARSVLYRSEQRHLLDALR